ncbi:SdpI family protein [Brevundimonas sp. Root1279]|uniref:SdpI family protein n=1 Tax=Brevundimonas sp. Root1279 TaxID=1736443 RepID=UPI0006F7B7D4|nr:SdpI family protein [Brevundimonas sp. Root1279]KQW86477.1 ammonium transporter [Brevundimonas sp. Root1279]
MKSEIRHALASAAAVLILALGASFARQQGWIDSDTTTRIVLCAIGLQVAWYGNRMPKQFAPSAAAQQVHRVGGWSMALSGLVYAGLWVFAPFDVALIGGCAAIILGMVVTIGYCLSARRRFNAA